MEKEFRFRGPGNLPIIPPLEESDEIEERDEQSAMTEDKKHSDRYFLQYKYIPDLVADMLSGKISVDDLMDKDWWECSIQLFKDMNFYFEWDELHCNKIKVDDDYEMVVYTFPKPRQTPDTAYGAALINITNKIRISMADVCYCICV